MASSDPAPGTPGTDRRVAYQPALDGVRAVSILAVLAFHLEAGWMPGGYLGVSVFFTLSGYLITSLLLAERRSTGGIALRAFYVRRARRLLPAALTCLAAVGALWSSGAFRDRQLGPELLGALAQVANWEALVRDRPYAELFMAPSPLAHFWSLAIEEQFYWLWPLAMLGLTGAVARRGRGGGSPSVLVPLLVAFGAFALSAPLTARWLGPDAVYLASWTRFAEILAGAVLAAALATRRPPAWSRHLALPALAAIAALCVLTPTNDGWVYRGGLPLFALLTVGLVLGLQHPGRTRRALSVAPMVGIGRISYGLYLYHWPVVVLLDTTRTGLDGPALAAVRLTVTFAVALVSFAVIEQPIRAGRAVLATTPRFALAAAAASVLVVGLSVRPPATERVVAVSPAPEAAPGPARPLGGETAVPEDTPTVVALLGDSVLDWLLRDAPGEDRIPGVLIVDGALEACDGAVDRPPVRDRRGRVLPAAPGCEEWPVSYGAVVGDPARPVDIAVASVGGGAFLDHQLPGGWAGPCEDMGWYVEDVRARLTYLDGTVGEVVVLLPSWLGTRATFALPDDHPERATCVREQMSAVAEELDLRVIDLARILCPEGPEGECSIFRELDGVHVDAEHAGEILTWLITEVTSGADHRIPAAVSPPGSSPDRAVGGIDAG